MIRDQAPAPRLRPVEPPYDGATDDLLAAMGGPLQIFRLFARKPERANAILQWGRYYLSSSCGLSLRHRELVIDRTTARCGSSYEWGVHIAVFAGKAGLTAEQVESTGGGSPDDACWTDAGDRLVLRAVDALVDHRDIDDALWAELVAFIGEEGAIDLLLLCGWYHAISFATRVPRLTNEAGTPELPMHRGDA